MQKSALKCAQRGTSAHINKCSTLGVRPTNVAAEWAEISAMRVLRQMSNGDFEAHWPSVACGSMYYLYEFAIDVVVVVVVILISG